MALLQITIIPIGTQSTSIGDYLAPIQQKLTTLGVEFQLDDMGTLIEGNLNELLAIVKDISEIPFELGAKRVVTQITIDDRRDKEIKIGDKVTAIKQRLS